MLCIFISINYLLVLTAVLITAHVYLDHIWQAITLIWLFLLNGLSLNHMNYMCDGQWLWTTRAFTKWSYFWATWTMYAWHLKIRPEFTMRFELEDICVRRVSLRPDETKITKQSRPETHKISVTSQNNLDLNHIICLWRLKIRSKFTMWTEFEPHDRAW